MKFMSMLPQAQPQIPGPAPAPAVADKIVIVGADGKSQTLTIPRTGEELRALQSRREQLSDQLESVTSRRSDLAEELSTTGAEAARPGIEARIGLLDQRILQLESDLATTGREIALASPEAVGTLAESEDAPVGGGGDNFEDGLMVGGFSVLAFVSIVLFITRRRWQRPSSGRHAQLGSDSAQRLERLEQGMDAIAIEIERVSEGQRFVTKLLSEPNAVPATSSRVAQPTVLESVDQGKR
jgi:hypothetical protein